jgi:DNA topoisomerase-1
VDEVFDVGLNRAVDLLAQKAAGGGRFGRARTPIAALKTFEHEGGTISVRDGRYGPYVNQGKVNATLPKTLKPEDVTLAQALELIAERAARGGGKTPARKAAARKAPAKKAAAKKPAAKKKAVPRKKAEPTA